MKNKLQSIETECIREKMLIQGIITGMSVWNHASGVTHPTERLTVYGTVGEAAGGKIQFDDVWIEWR